MLKMCRQTQKKLGDAILLFFGINFINAFIPC